MKNKKITLAKAVASLRPNSIWSYSSPTPEEDYSYLNWSDENELPKPTLEEIQLEIKRLEEEWATKEYQRLRAAEYPDIKEYLDAVVKNDKKQIKKYINDCLEVKKKYPKPEGS